jgi:hypothetical protein
LLLGITEIVFDLGSVDIIPDILYEFMTKRLGLAFDNCENLGPQPYLTQLLEYFNKFGRIFIEIVFHKILNREAKQKSNFDDLIKRLIYFIYETYAHRMIKQIFDIILNAEEINIMIIREIREAVE